MLHTWCLKRHVKMLMPGDSYVKLPITALKCETKNLQVLLQMNRVESPLSWLFSFGCKFQPNRDKHVAEVVLFGSYCYFLAKLLDLFDTVFFVLRKKTNQISFLHLYHHSLTFVSAWYYLKYMVFEVESGIFIGLLNSFVHILM